MLTRKQIIWLFIGGVLLIMFLQWQHSDMERDRNEFYSDCMKDLNKEYMCRLLTQKLLAKKFQ